MAMHIKINYVQGYSYDRHTGVWKKHSSGKKYPWKYWLSECQIRDSIAVSASRLQDKGSPKRNDFFTDTGRNNHILGHSLSAEQHVYVKAARAFACPTDHRPEKGREFRDVVFEDVVFEDVVFDNNSSVAPY